MTIEPLSLCSCHFLFLSPFSACFLLFCIQVSILVLDPLMLLFSLSLLHSLHFFCFLISTLSPIPVSGFPPILPFLFSSFTLYRLPTSLCVFVSQPYFCVWLKMAAFVKRLYSSLHLITFDLQHRPSFFTSQ